MIPVDAPFDEYEYDHITEETNSKDYHRHKLCKKVDHLSKIPRVDTSKTYAKNHLNYTYRYVWVCTIMREYTSMYKHVLIYMGMYMDICRHVLPSITDVFIFILLKKRSSFSEIFHAGSTPNG